MIFDYVTFITSHISTSKTLEESKITKMLIALKLIVIVVGQKMVVKKFIHLLKMYLWHQVGVPSLFLAIEIISA